MDEFLSLEPNFSTPPQYVPRTDTGFLDNTRAYYTDLGNKFALFSREFNTGDSYSFLGYDKDPNFNIEDYRNPANSFFIDAIIDDERQVYSEQHLNDIIGVMRDSIDSADQYARSTFGAVAGSMVVDPMNLVPVAGWVGRGNALVKVGRIAAINTALETPDMLLSYSENPLYDGKMLAANVGYTAAASVVFAGIVDRVGAIATDAVNGAYRNYRGLSAQLLLLENLQKTANERVAAGIEARAPRMTQGEFRAELEFRGESLLTVRNGKIASLTDAQLDARRNTDEGLRVLDEQELHAAIDGQSRTVVGINRTMAPLLDAQNNGTITAQQTRNLARLQAALGRAESKLNFYVDEGRQRLIDEATIDGVFDPYHLMGNLNPIPSPFKRILNATLPENAQRAGLDMLKRATLLMAGDQATITRGGLAGIPMEASVWIRSITERRRWAGLKESASSLYQELYKANTGVTNVGAAMGQRPTLNQFLNEAYWDRALGRPSRSPQHASASRLFDDFYGQFELELRQSGVIGDLKRIQHDAIILEQRMVGLGESINRTKDPTLLGDLITKRAEIEVELNQLRVLEQDYSRLDFRPNGEPYIHRIWDIEALRGNDQVLEAFKDMLGNNWKNGGFYFEYNNTTKRFERVNFAAATAQEIKDAVDRTVDRMLNDKDVNQLGMSMVESISYAHRNLASITNAEAAPFLTQDAMRTVQAYTESASPKLHFAQMFNGRSPKEVWNDIEIQLLSDGTTVDRINELRRDFSVLEQRVMSGSVLKDPARWDNQTASFLKNFTSLNYLVTSGLPGVADFARIVQNHELKNVFNGLFNVFFDEDFRKLMRQTQTEFGEGLELAMGSLAQGLAEGAGRQVGVKDIMGRATHVNHILNLLGPVTTFLKQFDGALRQHTLIDYMRKMDAGTASQFEIDYITRHGISISAAREIVNRAPIQSSGSFTLANVDDWLAAGVQPETIRSFRNAMNAGVANTILMATPADRPIFADGVFFVRKGVADRIPFMRGLAEDDVVKGYVRIESGLMTLPLQFQAYMMGAMNKVTGAYATGAVRNRYAGLAASMGLGYLILAARTPDYVWEQMDMTDRLARAFDYGGVAPLYTTLLYDHMSLSRSLGHVSPVESVFAPKFPQKESIADAATTFLGPASSTVVDFGRGVGNLATGNFAEAGSEFLHMVPLWETMTVQMFANAIAKPFQ